jgi:7,8-dihydro-6-hydroxymethylpterin dimethyltransferase
MSGVPVADVVPNALPLADRLTTTPCGSKLARAAMPEDPR